MRPTPAAPRISLAGLARAATLGFRASVGRRADRYLRMAGLLALLPSTVMAQPASEPVSSLLNQWDTSPQIVAPTLIALALYGLGLARRPSALEERPWRHAAFFWGVAITYLSVGSPLDAMADHLFAAHQVQHMLIRVVGPMLIAFSQPQGLLTAGLPRGLRRGGLAPVITFAPLRTSFAVLTRPAVATAIFAGSLYVWQWPPLHNFALDHEGVHYLMHVTMLLAGLLFFWRIFDQRPAPKGVGFGVRLMMLWVGVLANIPIGAYTSFKDQLLYPAYGAGGRLFGLSGIDDERLGGFIMWAPCSMMMLVAVLVVIHAWGRHEEKADARGVRAPAPQTAEALIARQRPQNRALAWGLLGFAACVLAATVSVGLLAVHGHPAGPGVHGRVVAAANASGLAARSGS